jgi:hypothetical protein
MAFTVACLRRCGWCAVAASRRSRRSSSRCWTHKRPLTRTSVAVKLEWLIGYSAFMNRSAPTSAPAARFCGSASSSQRTRPRSCRSYAVAVAASSSFARATWPGIVSPSVVWRGPPPQSNVKGAGGNGMPVSFQSFFVTVASQEGHVRSVRLSRQPRQLMQPHLRTGACLGGNAQIRHLA